MFVIDFLFNNKRKHSFVRFVIGAIRDTVEGVAVFDCLCEGQRSVGVGRKFVGVNGVSEERVSL